MIFLETVLPIIIYFLLIIILIVGIILGIKAIITINKVEKVVDDVNDKIQSLNGFFSVIDFTTDKIVALSDRFVEGTINLFGKLFSRSKKKRNEDDDDE